MTTIVNHDIRSVNGKYLVMPPWKAGQTGWGNLAIPSLCVDGGDSTMQWPVNTKFVDFDRTHIYGYCSLKATSDVKSNVGLFNWNTPINDCTWGGVAGAVGDTTLPFLTSDLTGYTTVGVNDFAGGYVMPRQANPYGTYRIVSNTEYAEGADSATETDFVIEEPGLQAIVTASSAYCYLDRNPYTAMKSEYNGTTYYGTVVGVTLIDPTALTYQWVQTWGPCHMLGGAQAGAGAYLRMQYFHQDGTLVSGAQVDLSTTYLPQPAGPILAMTLISSSGVYGALVQLQIER